MKRYKYQNIIVLFCICIVAAVATLLLSGWSLRSEAISSKSLQPEVPVGKILKGTSIIQEFRSKIDGLSSLSIMFATYARENDGHIEVLLKSENGDLIFKKIVDVSTLDDNKYKKFKFASISNSKEKKYLLLINGIDGTQRNAVTIWKSDNSLADASAKLSVSGKFVTGTLCFSYAASSAIMFLAILAVFLSIAAAVWIVKSFYQEILDGNYRQKNFLLLIVACVYIIFLILYNKFIFGNAFYIYHDLGSDTVNSYLPYYRYIVENLKNGTLDFLSLNQGLGVNNFTLSGFILDPYTYLLLLFPASCISEAILWITLAKYLSISIIAYFYFKQIAKAPHSIFIGVLLWTFSSYNVLWGQHYFFLTAMVFFTLNMFLLEKLINGEKKYCKYYIINLAIFCAFSPYFMYMTGIFSAVYMMFRSFSKKLSFKEFVKNEFILALNGLLGVIISAGVLLPWFMSYLESCRSSSVTNLNIIAMLKPASFSVLLTSLGRFYSSNFLGTIKYSMWGNYYEAPILAAGLLIFFAVSYYLFIKVRIMHWCIAVLVALSLCMPVTNWLLTGNMGAMRWTYILVWTFILIIVAFLDDFKYNKHDNRIAGILASLFFVFGLVFLYSHYHEFNRFIIYLPILFILYLIYFFSQGIKVIPKSVSIIFLVFLVLSEIVLANYATINARWFLDKDDLAHKVINGDLYYKIKPLVKNKELCRTTIFMPTDILQQYTLPLLFNYYGVSTYNSMSPLSLKKALPAFELSINGNMFGQLTSDLYIETALAVKKKIIVDASGELAGYHRIYQKGNINVFEKDSFLPFGYIYTQQISLHKRTALSPSEQNALRLSCFYFTNPQDENACANVFKQKNHALAASKIEQNLFINNGTACAAKGNLTGNGIMLKTGNIRAGVKVKIILPGDMPEGYHTVKMEIVARVNSLAFIQVGKDLRMFSIKPGRYSYAISLPYVNISEIELYSWTALDIKKLSVISDTAIVQNIADAVNELKACPVTEISYQGSEYHAQLDNTTTQPGMLCIPFSYSNGWKAAISGKDLDVYNINGGLVGLIIPPGQHDLVIKWLPPYFYFSLVISLFGIIVTVLLSLTIWRRKTMADSILNN